MLYESLNCVPAVAHLNVLLRQQSENAFKTSKNWCFLHFFAVFLDFLIFRILHDFEVVWLSISIDRLNFLPSGGLKSPGHGISSLFRFFYSYSVRVPTLNCRDLDDCASAGALALHAQIFSGIFWLSIMNQALLRWWKLMNQKYFSYSVHVPFGSSQMLPEKNFPRHGVAFSRSAMTVRP